MCSICGIGLLKENKIPDVEDLKGYISRLFKAAVTGGSQAAGMAFTQPDKISVVKDAVSSAALVDTNNDWIKILDEHVVIADRTKRLVSATGHCRMPTKGSVMNNDNNHPIIAGDIVGAHNGVIGNDDRLFNAFGNRFGRIAQVDSEIIFQLINLFMNETKCRTIIPAIKKTASLLKGWFACSVVSKSNPFMLSLFRNSAPISIRLYPEVGLVAYATRPAFIDKAEELVKDAYGPGREIDLPENSGITFNLHTGDFSVYSILIEDQNLC